VSFVRSLRQLSTFTGPEDGLTREVQGLLRSLFTRKDPEALPYYDDEGSKYLFQFLRFGSDYCRRLARQTYRSNPAGPFNARF
jgi:hypothetical protein